MNDWKIRNVPQETINVIKQRAVDYGCTIPEILSMEFGGNPKLIKGDSWLLYNIDQDVRQKLTARAKKHKKPINLILKSLLKKRESPVEVERRVREEAVNNIRDYLKDFVKSY